MQAGHLTGIERAGKAVLLDVYGPARIFDYLHARGKRIAHLFEACMFIQFQLCLIQQPVRPCPARLPGGVKSNPGLSHPHQQGADTRSQGGSEVGDTGARLEHDAGNAADGNVAYSCSPVSWRIPATRLGAR